MSSLDAERAVAPTPCLGHVTRQLAVVVDAARANGADGSSGCRQPCACAAPRTGTPPPPLRARYRRVADADAFWFVNESTAEAVWDLPAGAELVPDDTQLDAAAAPANDLQMVVYDAAARAAAPHAAPAAPPWFCNVCYEPHAAEAAMHLGCCGRPICRASLARAAIAHARARFVGRWPRCFSCDAPVAHGDLAAASREAQRAMAAAARLAGDASAAACPARGCGGVALGGSAAAPALVCPDCAAPFCFLHGDAHAPGDAAACAAFEAAGAPDAATAAVMRCTTRACPGCGARTERTAGCDHMVCTRCTTSWCWCCGL